MEIVPFKFQATAFCNNEDFKPDAKSVQSLFNGLVDWEIFPNITKELQLKVNGLSAKPEQVDRLQFISSDKTRRINFLGNRIDFELFINKNSAKSSIEEFISNTIQQIEVVTSQLQRKYNRLSLVSLYYIDNKDVDFFNEVYSKIYQTPVELNEQKKYPYEWHSRSVFAGVLDINGSPERINYNTNFGRKLQLGNSYLSQEDRLELVLDINTHQGASSFRFSSKEFADFLSQTVTISNELRDKIVKTL